MLKLLEYNVGKNLHDFGLYDFLDVTPKAQLMNT